MTKNWTMNETQARFIEILKAHAGGITLFELKLEGINFATGSINTLVTKGIVEIAGEKSFECDIVFNGTKVGKTTKTNKIYKLVNKD